MGVMEGCSKRNSSLLPIFLFLFLFLFLFMAFPIPRSGCFVRFAEGGQRRIHISDDLDDVIDDEEDEAWKEWGKKPAPPSPQFDIPEADFSKMDISEIQEKMASHHSGPAFGFVKLRLGVRRSQDMVSQMASKWTKVLRTGGIEVKFMGIDLSTVMFTMERGQDAEELKEFVLNQSEAYEIKIGDRVFRRPGDLPLDEVAEMLRKEKHDAEDTNNIDHDRGKEEL